jgi:hypothetical protein
MERRTVLLDDVLHRLVEVPERARYARHAVDDDALVFAVVDLLGDAEGSPGKLLRLLEFLAELLILLLQVVNPLDRLLCSLYRLRVLVETVVFIRVGDPEEEHPRRDELLVRRTRARARLGAQGRHLPSWRAGQSRPSSGIAVPQYQQIAGGRSSATESNRLVLSSRSG